MRLRVAIVDFGPDRRRATAAALLALLALLALVEIAPPCPCLCVCVCVCVCPCVRVWLRTIVERL